jgi:X-X-X-Leu-X-X-Gly heptad repeat protein
VALALALAAGTHTVSTGTTAMAGGMNGMN